MKIKGIVVTEGLAIGHVYKVKTYHPTIIDDDIALYLVDTYKREYQNIVSDLVDDINTQLNDASLKTDQRDLLNAHKEMIQDPFIIQNVLSFIQNGKHPSKAITMAYQPFIDSISELDNPYMKSRLIDVKDVKLRLLKRLDGITAVNEKPDVKNLILCAAEILPSDLTQMDHKIIKGIISEQGSPYSHTAIIAKGLNIPYVFGIKDIHEKIEDNALILLDTFESTIEVNPSQEMLHQFDLKTEAFYKKESLLNKFISGLNQTKDGVSINIELNIHHAMDKGFEFEKFVDGVGLFRTELYYMSAESIPTVSEQMYVYQSVLSQLKDKPVAIRLLDIGGDKTLPYYPLKKETNPFLGKRGIRLTLEDTSLLLPQLEALLKVNNGQLKVLIPMVSTLEELLEVKTIINTLRNDLIQKGHDIKPLPIGIMIEVPSIVYQLDDVLEHIDFASIGTNDLTQYALGMDRMNDDISSYYKAYHPFIFKMLKDIVEKFNQNNVPISICGELASDPHAIKLLLGLGYRSFSINASRLARVKQELSQSAMKDCEVLAQHVLNSKTENDVKKLLNITPS